MQQVQDCFTINVHHLRLHMQRLLRRNSIARPPLYLGAPLVPKMQCSYSVGGYHRPLWFFAPRSGLTAVRLSVRASLFFPSLLLSMLDGRLTHDSGLSHLQAPIK